MSEATPTRSAVVELKDERRAMHDGYVFLDEKCLLLAGEMLRELQRHEALARELADAHARAIDALQAALARHGLEELSVHPPASMADVTLEVSRRAVIGVRLQQASLRLPREPMAAPSVNPSPEARACRRAFAELMRRAAPLAAVRGNLERLSLEYRRAVRRARALHDVLLPELDRSVAQIETRLEELEQEDAIWMRQGARQC